MRTRRLVLLCVALGGLLGGFLGGCSILGQDPPPRAISQPPTEIALQKSVMVVAKTLNWPGTMEASPVRQANLLAPADWIVCAQSGARDLSPPLAMFFDGDTMVHVRTAVQLDDCWRAPYAPVPVYVEPPREPLAIKTKGKTNGRYRQ